MTAGKYKTNMSVFIRFNISIYPCSVVVQGCEGDVFAEAEPPVQRVTVAESPEIQAPVGGFAHVYSSVARAESHLWKIYIYLLIYLLDYQHKIQYYM
jgi:hypothetical protein